MKKIIVLFLILLLVFSAFSIVGAASASGTQATVTGGWLRLRSGPSQNSSTIASYYTGTTVELLSEYLSGWYRVKVSDGKIGYMKAEFLIIGGSTPTPSGTTAYVTSQNGYGVRLRCGPGTGYRVIRTYAVGTKVTVLSSGTSWSRISINGITGYMMSCFLTSGGVTPTEYECLATVWSGNGYGVRLRTGPGTNYSIIGKYSVGTKVYVLSKGTVWDKVMIGSRVGYMMNEFLHYYGKQELTSVTINTLTPSVNDILSVTAMQPYGATATFQWVVDGVVKSTDSSYTVTSADVGCRIQLIATGSGQYSGTVYSAKTEKVVPATQLKSVELNNYSPVVGDKMTVTITPSDATVTYSWLVGTVEKSTGASYTVLQEDLGLPIRVVVTGTGSYTGVLTSYPTNNVAPKGSSLTVYFDTDGKCTPPEAVHVTLGNTVAQPSLPEVTGYTLDHWELNGAVYDFASPVTADITLKAVWKTLTTYTITFLKGDISVEVQDLPAAQTVNSGAYAVEPAAPKAEGYTFDGWYCGKNLFQFGIPVTADAELTAHWTKDTVYTVTFDNNHYGTKPADQKVSEGQCAVEPPKMTAENVSFQGWYLNNSEKYDFSTPVTKNIKLYALWTSAATYEVSFNNNGHGTAPATQYIPAGTYINDPGALTEAGYRFNGWLESGKKFDIASTPVNSALTLIADWDEQFTVTFDCDGHGTAPAQQKVYDGDCAVKPEDPIEEGWIFAGWYNGANLFDFTVPVTGNLTLKAQWTRIQCTVDYNNNGLGGTVPSSETVSYGSTIVKPADLSAAGYVFTGWYTDKGSKYDFSEAVKSSFTLYAGWQSVNVTITFNNNGFGTAPSPVQVSYGTPVSNPGSLSAEGHIFKGWSLDGSSIYDFSTPVTKDMTLFALWEDQTFTVTFNNNGIGSTPAQQTISYGSTVSKPADPSANGYTFTGWYLDAYTPYDFSSAVKSNLVLYAAWTKNTYTVSFDCNGHGSSPSAQQIIYGECAVNPGSISETGWNFEGWYNGSELFDFSVPISGNITLTAKWTTQKYIVTFDLRGVAATYVYPQEIEYNGSVQEPTAPVATGYNFLGWSYENGTEYDFTTAKVTSDITLYAVWKKQTFVVSFDTKGYGSSTYPSQTVEYLGYASNPGSPEDSGYSFVGWYDNATGEVFDFNTMITKDVFLFAKWVAK